MKKNGFIATSILYSFFLVFVTLFVALISAYLHNRLLLNKMNDESWKLLLKIKNTRIKDLQVGDYVTFSTIDDSAVVSGAKWIVAYTEEHSGEKTVYFMSDGTAANQFIRFKSRNDVIVREHLITPINLSDAICTYVSGDSSLTAPRCYRQDNGRTIYQDAFHYKGFQVQLPTTSLLKKIRGQTLSDPQILESIYEIGQNSFVALVDDGASGFNNGNLIEMRMYDLSNADYKSLLSNYCGADYDPATNTIKYFEDRLPVNGQSARYKNEIGYVNVVKDSVKNEKYVDFCVYASKTYYEHAVSDKVTFKVDNKTHSIVNEVKPYGDLVQDYYSSNYGYRLILVASGTISENHPNSPVNQYIAGGKGLFMDPYLFTDGAKIQ